MLINTLINGVVRKTDDSLMEKREGVVDNENERTTWVEYRMNGSDVIVHRSAHVILKKASVFGAGAIGEFANG